MKARHRIGFLVFVLLAIAPVFPAQAQYPSGPIRIIYPFGAGGSGDLLVRVFAERLNAAMGQPVIVENKPGAGGAVGAAAAAAAPADGYTLLSVSTSFVIAPGLTSKPLYDPLKDFTPVSRLSFVPNVLVVNPGVPARSMAELVAYAKANPGKLNFGSSGNGTTLHLAGQQFKSVAGIEIVHVPYRGSAQAVTDLVAGQVQMIFDSMPSALPHIRTGALRPLAVATEKRVPELADVPTTAEAGFPQLVSGVWTGIVAPTGTPAAIVGRLNDALSKIVREQAVLDRLTQLGATAYEATPTQFANFLREEKMRWDRAIAEAGARTD